MFKDEKSFTKKNCGKLKNVSISKIKIFFFLIYSVKLRIAKYPSEKHTDAIYLTVEDLKCLDDCEYLNDSIINFYLKLIFFIRISCSSYNLFKFHFRYLLNEKVYDPNKTYIFNSFFYDALTKRPVDIDKK